MEQQANIKPGPLKADTGAEVTAGDGTALAKSIFRDDLNDIKQTSDSKRVTPKAAIDGSDNNDEDDEYESVSDSSDYSSGDSGEDDGDNDDKINKAVQGNNQNDLKHYINDDFNLKTLSATDSHNKGKNDSVCSTGKRIERVLSYTGFTESGNASQASESEQGDDSDDDDEYDFSAVGYRAIENKSPSKILTRKVAGRDDKNKFPFQNLPSDTELLQSSLNVSAFAPKAKSPITISKEKVSMQDNVGSLRREVLSEETQFSYHSDSDSIGNKQNESFSEEDDERLSNGNKNSRKNFGEKKTLQFDDDDEWGELTPKVLKSRRRKDSEGDHDKTLIDDSEKEMPASGIELKSVS